jgi:hypothetical protein
MFLQIDVAAIRSGCDAGRECDSAGTAAYNVDQSSSFIIPAGFPKPKHLVSQATGKRLGSNHHKSFIISLLHLENATIVAPFPAPAIGSSWYAAMGLRK